MSSAVNGILAAAVTPRRLGTQDINLSAMWDLVDFLSGRGAQGIVLLGSTGEFVHFSNSERMRLMGLAVKRSRIPVVFNCSHSSFDGVVELTQAADASGAAGVLVMPPYFFRYSQEYLLDFYRQVVIESEASIPVLLYNIPQFTTGISFEVAATLLREGVVQGIKDSSGDWQLFEQFLQLRQEVEFSLLAGNDMIAARARAAGCDGIVSGVASAIPELLVALDRSILTGAAEVQTRLEVRLRQFIEWADHLPAPIAVKEATAVRGLKLGPHSLPYEGELQVRLDAFRQWFKDWLPQMLNECKHA
jgi:4-hydroxy-tetrahydrodipicolinate synthase